MSRRAFTPGASVSEAKRQRVLAATQALGYRPNALARAMISGRSRLVALLVAYLDNGFYPIVLERLSRALQNHGYHVLLFMTQAGDQDQVVQRILQYQLGAIVMASATLSSSLARECAETGIPVVLFNRSVPASHASSVTSDNVEGGRLLARFLERGGHRRIAFVDGQEDSSTNRDREADFRAGLAEHGMVPRMRAVGGYTTAGAAAAAHELFGRAEQPDAVFAAAIPLEPAHHPAPGVVPAPAPLAPQPSRRHHQSPPAQTPACQMIAAISTLNSQWAIRMAQKYKCEHSFLHATIRSLTVKIDSSTEDLRVWISRPNATRPGRPDDGRVRAH